MDLIYRGGVIPLCAKITRPKCTMLISSASMISQHAKKKDWAVGFDDGIQSNTMDICQIIQMIFMALRIQILW